jgi:pimeloyl-ACP methyl ester carboxylesterase
MRTTSADRRLAPIALAFLAACSGSSDPDTNTAAWSAPCPVDEPELRRVDVGEVELNVACQGEGPTVVLLHGFPEFWRGWAEVMAELAGRYRLIAPDQRGYNLSDKPEGIDAYRVERLIGDAVALIDHVSSEPVVLVGHDWGGAVAWPTAAFFPDRVRGLVIANAPHPNVFARLLASSSEQQQASGYVTLFVSPSAEAVLAANDYGVLRSIFAGILDDAALEHYVAAWSQPGALTGSLNWYRASWPGAEQPVEVEVRIDVPTLVLWGMRDLALRPENLEGLEEYVPDLRVERFEEATHWIAHEEPARVARAIDDFARSLP